MVGCKENYGSKLYCEKLMAYTMLIAFVFILWCVPLKVRAAVTNYDNLGDGVTGTFDDVTGTLTISKTGDGTGAMTDYSSEKDRPYHNIRDSVKKVIVESGVTSIGLRAFFEFTNLTEISLPETLISIKGAAFYGCSKIESIELPDSVTSIGGDKNDFVADGGGVFQGCTSLNKINIPDGVEFICFQAFDQCKNLKEIDIPNSVTTIKEGAFGGCDELTSISFPDSLTTIDKNSFYGCNSLSVIKGGKEVSTFVETESWGAFHFFATNPYGSENKLTTYLDPNASDALKNYDWSKCNRDIVIGDVNEGTWTLGLTADADYLFSGGSGTEADPYLISNTKDLAMLAFNVYSISGYSENMFFEQTADIDLAGRNWLPIGFGMAGKSNAFAGNYDGQGFKISNMVIDSSKDERIGDYIGLFGRARNNAVIKNIWLENANINIISDAGAITIGALIGMENPAIISDCFVNGNVSFENNGNIDGYNKCFVGGLMGVKNSDGGSLSNCCFIGNVDVTGTGTTDAGGMVGNVSWFSNSNGINNNFVAAKISSVDNGSTSYPNGKYAFSRYCKNNCYYDATVNTKYTDGYGTAKTSLEMKTSEMAELLGEAWIQNYNVNDGYPILRIFDRRPHLSGNSVYRKNAENADVWIMSDEAGTVYYKVTEDATEVAPSSLDGWTMSGSVKADTARKITLEGLATGAKYVHVVVKDDDDILSDIHTIDMPYDVYLKENFEGYKNDADNDIDGESNFPYNVNFYDNQKSRTVKTIEGNKVYKKDDFYLENEYDCKSLERKGNVKILEGDIYCDSDNPTAVFGFYQYNWNHYQAAVKIDGGSWKSVTGYFKQNESNDLDLIETKAVKNKWYKIRIVYDIERCIYDVYIDGKKANSEPITAGVPTGGYDAMRCDSSKGQVVYFDNIEYYCPFDEGEDAVKYDFDKSDDNYKVDLSTPHGNRVIYYTVDGGYPNIEESGTKLYTESLFIQKNTTLNAVCGVNEGESFKAESVGEKKVIVLTPTNNSGLTYNGTSQVGITYDENLTYYTMVNDTETTSVSSATDVGDYSATFKLKSGSVWGDGTTEDKTINWSIVPKTLIEDNVSLEYSSVKYSGEDREPTVTVKVALAEGEDAVTLTKDTDYTFTYSDNKDISTADKFAKVTVIGKGNYSGTVVKEFTITDKDIQTLSFEESSLDVTFGDGVTGQVASNDKTDGGAVTYVSNNEHVAVVDATTGVVEIKGAGTAIITATASENAEYKSASASYTINVSAKEISEVVLEYDTIVYDGENKQPTLVVKVDGKELSSDEYVVEYKDNTDAGTATVTVKGKGNYGGSVAKTFTITKASQKQPTVSKADETVAETSNGKITGVTNEMEYRKDGETTYTAISGTELEGLAPGTYYVRYKAQANFEASPDIEIIIKEGEKKSEPKVEPVVNPEPVLDKKLAPVPQTTEEPKKEPVKPAPIAEYDENVPVEEKHEVIVNTNTDDKDVEGSTQKYLFLTAKPSKTSIKLSWKKIAGADGYIIYGNKCGIKMEKITTLAGNKKTWMAKKLKKGKYYKYMVVAYRNTEAGENVITTSKSVHAVTDGGKKGNPTTLKLKKTKISVKIGKTIKIKASISSKKKVATHIAKFRYESSNEDIATVSEKGVVTGIAKGKATIYVYTQNGMYKKVTVIVK